ncbi:MAG: acylphosphatase [Candidatus Hydromicrobium americanum]|nr:MAG: acylphosphatase [Candidatus Hydromicrobium americanum]
MKTYKVVLFGRVQGVGFRYFVESIASKYDISGYVRNTFNGKVEVVCQGEEEELKQFIDEVKKGPAFSVVTDVKIEEIKDSKKYSIFDIKF